MKHLATVEWGHFGAAFGDPLDEHLPWVTGDTEASADMWVEPTEIPQRDRRALPAGG